MAQKLPTNRACGPVRRARRGVILNEKGVLHPFFKLFPRTFLLPLCLLQPSAAPSVKRALFSYSPRYGSVCPMPLAWARAAHSACISAAVTLVVCLISNHSQQEKTRALMEYKLEELTKRVDKHNNVVERTYALEQELKVQEEQIKVANHRINDLEQKG